MIKWVLLIVGLTIAIIFVIALIKFMLKAEKDSKTNLTENAEQKLEEYTPEEKHIDIHSATGGVPVMDLSNNEDKKAEREFVNDIMADFDNPINTGFIDSIDNEFDDYSKYAHKSKGRRRPSVDFDLDGDFADEYIPDSPDFNYLPSRRQTKKQPINKALNELPTELKVLMLSDIFDRKFFD